VGDSLDQATVGALEVLAARVRKESCSGVLVKLAEVWPGTPDGLIESVQDAQPRFADIALIRTGEHAYVYSEKHMTRSYAESAARSQCEDLEQTIAETVRIDSRTYPRPTPAAIFTEAPFRLSEKALAAVIDKIAREPAYPDIRLLRASDGSVFFFSSAYLNPVHAELLVEWNAVGQSENP